MSRSISVRQGLLIGTAILVLFVSGSVLAVSLVSTKRITEAVAAPLMAAAVEETEMRLAALFDPIRGRIVSDYAAIRSGLFAADETASLKAVFIPQLYALPHVGSMMLGSAEGDQFLVMRYDEAAAGSELFAGRIDQLPKPRAGIQQFFTREVRVQEWGERSRWALLDENGGAEITSWDLPLPGYDPRERPWHKAAVAGFRDLPLQEALASAGDLVAWTDVYTLFTTKTPGISASVAARAPSGRIQIIAYDLLLDEIADFTAQAAPVRNGQVFVMTDDGRLLGPPGMSGPDGERVRAEMLLRQIGDTPFAKAAEATAQWQSRGQVESVRGPITLNGEPWWVGFSAFHVSDARRLWIGVLLPERDLVPGVGAGRAAILRISAAALVIGAILALILARWIARPLRQLANQSRRITRIDLDEPAPVRSRIIELNALSCALREMREALRGHIARGEQARREIVEREAQVRTLSENTPDVVTRIDREGTFVYANPAIQRATGLPAAGVMGRRVSDPVFPPVLSAMWMQAMRDVVASGQPRTLEFAYPTPEGARDFETRLEPEIDRSGQVTTVLTVSRDITERRRFEQALRRSEERYRTLIESDVTGIVVHRGGAIWFVNTAATRILGCDPVDAAEKRLRWDGLIAPASLPDVLEAEDVVMRRGGSLPTGEWRLGRPDQGVRWVEAMSTYIEWEGSDAVISFLRDVTDLRAATQRQAELEDQLRQSQKLEAVGLLASGVAHDFNNLLQVIGGNAALVTPGAPASETAEYVQAIRDAVLRASQMTRQLLVFSRRQRLSMESIDLRELVSEHLNMLRRMMPEGITITFDGPDAAVPVFVDRGNLEQVMLNLCLNARDAMPRGGFIRVSLERVETAGTGPGALGARPHARLEVADTGGGIDPVVMDRIFEPFFSTKPREKGTGLGLSVVYGIVHQHDGIIEARNLPEGGASFVVHLPISPEEPGANASVNSLHSSAGTGHVLLAEDDEQVRLLASRVLRRGGYTVTAVPNGAEACAAFAAAPDQFDLLCLDVLMPEVGGFETARRCRAVRPGIPVLFASGYAAESLSDSIEDSTISEVLQKPYDVEHLLTSVRRLLEARSS